MKIFLDSSILVEYIKDDKKILLEELLSRNLQLAYNSTVLSEYIYYFIGYYGTKSPRTLKENHRVQYVLSEQNPLILLTSLEQITENYPTADSVLRLMKTYNMLPNDAIILAHCLTTGIRYLVSYDVTDFATPCREEGIIFIDSVEALNLHVPVP